MTNRVCCEQPFYELLCSWKDNADVNVHKVALNVAPHGCLCRTTTRSGTL